MNWQTLAGLSLLYLMVDLSHCKADNKDTIESVLEFTVDLKSLNETEVQFIAQIQTVFCPEQPLCGQYMAKGDVTQPTNVISNISLTSPWANLGEISELLGVCCFPCSCSQQECPENNNCCLSKQTVEQLPSAVKTECIGATSKSYFSKTSPGSDRPWYSMITECFNNTVNEEFADKCERPDIEHLKADETTPVSSLITGRTYWNRYCALCLNDSEALVFWNAVLLIDRPYVIFKDRSIPVHTVENFSKFYDKSVAAGELLYTKPKNVEPSLCVPEVAFQRTNTLLFQNICQRHVFLQEACEKYHSPVQASFKTYKNIFCLLCLAKGQSITPRETRDCLSEIYKSPTASYTALLNHKFIEDNKHAPEITKIDKSQANCPCHTILDTFKHICRRLYCSPDEMLEMCQCSPFVVWSSGMAFRINIKVRAMTRSFSTYMDGFEVLAGVLKEALEKTYSLLEFEIMGIFKTNNTDNAYTLFVTRARAVPSHDVKHAFQELADKLEVSTFIQFTSENCNFEAELTNRINCWKETSGYKAKDTIENIELETVYADSELYQAILYSQELSRLLFCKQVELDISEFSEQDGVVTLNVSESAYETSHYFHTATDKIRVCTKDFIAAMPVMAATAMKLRITPTIVIYLVIVVLRENEHIDIL